MRERARKIFISHSSDDKEIINQFIETILISGCGIAKQDIFCTLDSTVIQTGEDFRKEIGDNLKDCDFILCFISDNYKKSEVCNNEMGASWILEGKRVLPFKLPNISFSEIGFLSVVKQCANVTDTSKLLELRNELCDFYNLEQKETFNSNINDFIDFVNEKMSHEYYYKYNESFSFVSSTQSLCQKALHEIEEITRTDYNQIILKIVKKYSDELHVVAAAISQDKQNYCIVSSDGLIKESYANNTTVIENSVRGLNNYFCAVNETESEICIPIAHNNHIYGVINSESEYKNHFSMQMQKKLEGLAQALAYNLNRLGWSKIPREISWPLYRTTPKYYEN